MQCLGPIQRRPLPRSLGFVFELLHGLDQLAIFVATSIIKWLGVLVFLRNAKSKHRQLSTRGRNRFNIRFLGNRLLESHLARRSISLLQAIKENDKGKKC